MALVDDDVAEVVGRVVGLEEARVRLVRVDVERLVGGDDDARVLLRVVAGRRGRVVAEDVLEGEQGLLRGARRGRTTKSARRSWPASAMRRSRLTAMKVLPAPVARLRRARFSPRASFSSDGADGGVLVVAAGRLAALVRREQRLGERRGPA